MNPHLLERAEFQRLLDVLRRDGYQVVAPTVRDGAIVYASIQSVAELPRGWTDEQDGGVYRLRPREDQALFGYAVGPHSWKKFLFPPRLQLWAAQRQGASFTITPEPHSEPPFAFLGIRSCELHALAIQDRVLLEQDPVYRDRREKAFLIAVHCGQAGGTCFCASMGTGPRATLPFDLALTEVVDGERHYFLVECGTPRGEEVAARLPLRPAVPDEAAETERATSRATAMMGRSMDPGGLRELLQQNPEHPRWDDVAARCLACSNCTMVCPTCFCTTVTDVTDLSGDHAERWRTWDSCFTSDFSALHGGSVRASTHSRYRQWLTHKLSTWHDQFGSSGCVGCGRCITWCPVGIDLTEEIRAMRTSEPQP